MSSTAVRLSRKACREFSRAIAQDIQKRKIAELLEDLTALGWPKGDEGK